MSARDHDGGRAPNPLPLPLILVVVSFFVLMAFETGQTLHDQHTLTELLQAQQASVDQGVKLRQQLQTLAGKTAELAAAGDAGAKSVVEQMKAQGITLGIAKK
jgi:hypothetical protein